MNLSGPWTEVQAADFMAAAIIPVRLSVIDLKGAPLTLSLWFLPDQNSIFCATQKTALVVRCLERNPRCGFEIARDAPPYRGVRGQGPAHISFDDGQAVLGRLLERYQVGPASKLYKLLTSNADQEVAIRIKIDWLTSWDFSQRMKDAIKP